MAHHCGKNCSGCASASCGAHTDEAETRLAPPHELSRVKRVVGVLSGKGGVGKSTVAALLAVAMARRGYRTAILDADVTGPSIPKMFGIGEKAVQGPLGTFPVKSDGGIEVMSLNAVLENDTDPLVWRGPMLGELVQRFWSEVIWNDIDFMFVDMPPGTSDVALTVCQSLPLNGIVIVTTPQELVSMIVTKAVKMTELLKIPILAAVENMAYFKCPDCGGMYLPFGASRSGDFIARYDIPVCAKMPLDPVFAELADAGKIETYEGSDLALVAQALCPADDAQK